MSAGVLQTFSVRLQECPQWHEPSPMHAPTFDGSTLKYCLVSLATTWRHESTLSVWQAAALFAVLRAHSHAQLLL